MPSSLPEPDLTPAAYTTGEPFQRERQLLFARNWLLFAASGQMPAPGDFVSHGIGGWPLVAIRGDDGVARAFHNVCRHQNMPVVEQPTGQCEILRCRYHGWAYRRDGSFYDAPTRLMPEGPAENFGLNPVELVEQDGFCWVRVRSGETIVPPSQASGRRFARAITTDIDANWKAVIEPLLENRLWRFVWPAALVGEPDGETAVVRQIVPRTFLRTRIVDLIFSANGSLADDLAAAQQQAAAADKAAAEACQGQRAAGIGPAPSPAVAEFLRQVAVASAEQPG